MLSLGILVPTTTATPCRRTQEANTADSKWERYTTNGFSLNYLKEAVTSLATRQQVALVTLIPSASYIGLNGELAELENAPAAQAEIIYFSL